MSAEAALRKLDPELELQIRDGTEHWRGGEITLTVNGAGRAEVLHRRAGEERTYSATLPRERVAELAGALADARLTGPRRSELKPDELTTTLRVRRGDELLSDVEVPGGERHEDERLDRVMRLYEELVAEVTDAALPFGEAAQPR